MAYKEREGLDNLLRLSEGEPDGSALHYMVAYRDLVRRLSWPAEKAWAHLHMPAALALEAINKGYVPHELFPYAKQWVQDSGLEVTEPPDVPMVESYKPRADLGAYFKTTNPGMDSPEWQMRLYWDWVHGPFAAKTPDQAWDDIVRDFSPQRAWEAIRRSVVPMEIYPRARELALKTGWTLPVPMVPNAPKVTRYEPRPDLGNYLTTLPAPNRDYGEFQMLLYWQMVHGSHPLTPQQAWNRIVGDLNPYQAYAAIQRKIVPIEIYPLARAIAAETGWSLPPP